MGVINQSYYFYNDIIDLKNFDARLLKIDKKLFKGIWYLLHWIYHEEKKLIVKMFSVNSLYLRIDHANGYIEEKKWK